MAPKPSGAGRRRCRTALPTCTNGIRPSTRGRGSSGCRPRRCRPPVTAAWYPYGVHAQAVDGFAATIPVVGLTPGEHRGARVPRSRVDARADDARRRHAGLGCGDPRRDRRQRRPPHPRAGPRRLAGAAAVGRQRLPPGAGLARARRRCARGPARAAPGLPRRGRVVHGRVGPVRPRPDTGPARRAARAPGCRGGAADSRAPSPSSRRRSAPRTAPRRSARGPGCRGWPRPWAPCSAGGSSTT